ncbi:Ser/Thr protein phosphatase family [Penicillium chermesinum]|nr:Ser/Thr protein phosphatase family [Penicillium chermesinum]
MSSHGNTYSYESDSNSDIEDSRHLNQASPALNHQKDSPRPLIDSVRNAWQTRSNPSYDLLSSEREPIPKNIPTQSRWRSPLSPPTVPPLIPLIIVLALLDQVEFSAKEGDHLIFTGDIINKGPDSSGVVDLAREKSASCVRGNHEDRILLLRHEMERTKALDGPQKGDKQIYSSKQLRERELARSLSKKQVEWLEQCPVILNIGRIPTMGQVVVVHGGLVPGLELEEQDPASVMTMRTIDVDTHLPSPESNGLSWAKMFDKHQSILFKSLQTAKEDPLSRTITAVYGHDAKTGLKIRTYTKGLDSGCVKGGKLTALVIEDGGKQSLVQVRCRDYTSG